MSFLTPLAFLGALIAIPIILLYMLRLRRREVVISSTFLWQQILKDNEANTPWQRLRRNVLLLLQLLILALLVVTLARPFITVPAVSAGQTALLLDASASMNAADINGEPRFEEAKRRALEIVDTMSAADTMTVIRVVDVPEVLAAYTDDRNALRNAIENAQPGQTRGDWVAALTLASAKAASIEDFNVVIISDGGLDETANLPAIPGKVRYVPVGQSDSNLAITALATRALPGRNPQLFVQIHNYGHQDADVILSLRVDGKLFDYGEQQHTVLANSDLSFVSEALPPGFTTIQASLTFPAEMLVPDYLAEDNNAWTVASGVENRRALLMSPGNLFLEQVLRSLPAVDVVRGDLQRGMPSQPFDLYVLDDWLPSTLPDGDLLIVNPPRSTPLFTVGAISQDAANPIVTPNDPRTAFLNFDNVNILQFKTISGTAWADVLVRADGGPLVLAGEIDGRQVAILTFDVHESDLPLQITWPVLMANLLEWFTPRNAITVIDGLHVGDPLAIRPPFEATTVRVTLPDGTVRTFPIERESMVFAETRTTGLYLLEILKGEEVLQSQPFAVNLFDPNESSIAPRQPSIGGQVIGETVREEIGQREFWPEVALLALIILLIEWVVYHRRLRVRTVMTPVMRRRRV